jgi:RNA polymerase sigma-70 factor (ECF subfamily)
MVYRRAYRILGRKEDAEEAMHEVFIRVIRSGDRFEGRSDVTTWLYQITTNYCLNLLRDRKRRRELMDAHLDEPDEAGGATDLGDLLLLRRLMAEADEREAQAVVYVFLDGMSQDQAASLLGTSQRTVSNLVDRFMRWAQGRAAGLRAAAAPVQQAAKGGGRS